jgi:C4-dicarboxylate transporter DctM subunit
MTLFFSTIVIVLLGLMLAGVAVGAALAISSLLGLAIVAGPNAALTIAGTFLYSKLMNFVLLAIPLYMLMGEIITAGGLTSRL